VANWLLPFISNKKIKTASAALLLLLPVLAAAQTTARLIPKKGLFITTNQLTWASGSELNFLTPDRKNHHYYFTWWEQDIDSTRAGKDILFIGSKNTAVYGSYSLQQNGGTAATFIDCNWNQQDTAAADIVYAKIWLPFFSGARWNDAQQKPITNFSAFDDTLLVVSTPFGIFQFRSSHPFKIRQNDNPNPGAKDYDKRSQYLLLYENNITVTKAAGLKRDFTVTQMSPPLLPTAHIKLEHAELKPVVAAWQPGTRQMLLPQPKFIQLKEAYYTIPAEKPAVVTPAVTQFRKLLQLQWQVGNSCFPAINVIQSNALANEGYVVEVLPQQVTITYKTMQGLQHALHTLAQLVKNDNGQLVLPQGMIKDEPSVSWRGIHMFTGPASWPLHRRMYDRVLLPLKMNKTVLQCEQAAWASRPEVHNSISVPLKDLKSDFDYLRQNRVEPIPLIQSLGHMEWFFKPQQNRFMAVNPQYPYTLNPDLPQAKKAVTQIWDEVFTLLKPKVMHIGFDEIGMIGFNLPREKEVEFFNTQITFLNGYAKKKNARLMLWGDMGLAPGEGPDALNGVTKERAAAIRSFIPPGSYVADWHYLGNANPEVYKKSLQIWKQNNNLPIASPWLWPDNVKGFAQAAIDEKAGVLQTTWADFESSEKNMLLNIEQFGAYILALDYAWSGRKELPKDLPYHPVEEWISRFYSQPKPLMQKNGRAITSPVQLFNISAASQTELPSFYELKFAATSTDGFKLKATTENILPEGTPAAVLQFYHNEQLLYEKQLRYGVELRSKNDQRCIYAHTPGHDEKVLFDFFQKKLRVTAVKIRSLHPASGLKVEELVLIE
jgi:Glycosyl hydrolase family 20, domain 2